MPLFIKMPKNIFSYDVSQYDKNSAYTTSVSLCLCNVCEEKAWETQYEKIWSEVELQQFNKLTTELIKEEDSYVNSKMETWTELIETKFYGQDVPYDMHCNTTAVLKTDSVYKEGKNYHPQAYVEKCKYTDSEKQQCKMLNNDDDEFFVV